MLSRTNPPLVEMTELRDTLREKVARCISSHLCKNHAFSRIGRNQIGTKCSVSELVNFNRVLSLPLAYGTGIGMQGTWVVTDILLNGQPESFPIDVFFRIDDVYAYLNSGDGWGTGAQYTMLTDRSYAFSDWGISWQADLDFNDVLRVEIIQGSDTYILSSARVKEQSTGCCLTLDNLKAIQCVIENYCDCIAEKGNYPTPEPEPPCDCSDGITLFLDWDSDDMNVLVNSVFFRYNGMRDGYCSYITEIEEVTLEVYFDVLSGLWTIAASDGVNPPDIISTSAVLYSPTWQIYGGNDTSINGSIVCGKETGEACIAIITGEGSVIRTVYGVYLQSAPTVNIGYMLFDLAHILHNGTQWVFRGEDVSGYTCHPLHIPGTVDTVPYGTYVDSCGRKIIVRAGACTELSACDMLYSFAVLKYDGGNGNIEIGLSISGGNSAYSVTWYSDAGRTTVIGTGTAYYFGFYETTYWYRVTDANGCIFESFASLPALPAPPLPPSPPLPPVPAPLKP